MSRVGQPVWSPRNYESFSREGYSQNVVAYACIRFIAEAIADLPLMEGSSPSSDHPFIKVLKRPNPGQSKSAFLDELASYLLLHGNSYIEAVMIRDDIAEIYSLRPDRVKVIPAANGWPAAFVYTVHGTEKTIRISRTSTDQQPMLQMKTFNPLDDWYGMSAIEPTGYAIDTHNSASSFNKSLLDNAGSPSGAFQYDDEENDGMLPETQFTRLKAMIEQKFSGTSNAGKPMLLEGGLKWVPIGSDLKDLEFNEGKAALAREICLGFGVPPMILGIPGDNTYANYAEAQRALYRNKVIPLAKRILGEISEFVQPTYPGLELTVNEDLVSALAGEREKLWERVEKSSFMTVAEKREAMGLPPYKPNENDPTSRILVNGGLTSIDEALEPVDTSGGEEPEEDPADDPDEDE